MDGRESKTGKDRLARNGRNMPSFGRIVNLFDEEWKRDQNCAQKAHQNDVYEVDCPMPSIACRDLRNPGNNEAHRSTNVLPLKLMRVNTMHARMHE